MSCDPYADVFEGQKHISEDGEGTIPIAAGRHNLRFVYLGITARKTVDVPENGTACVSVVFRENIEPKFLNCSGPQ